MTLGLLLLAIWLILVGLVWVGAFTLSSTFLGAFAIAVGVVLLVERYVPVTVARRAP